MGFSADTIYLASHQAVSVLISRVTGVADANATRRADAPVPDARTFLAALMSALAAWPQATRQWSTASAIRNAELRTADIEVAMPN